MKIEIITTGDEVMQGVIVDTNTSWIAERCFLLGHEVVWHTSVADDEASIANALKSAATRADAVIVTGGLGPTSDDITIESAAKAFGKKLVCDESVLQTIKEYFARVGRPMSKSNDKQAYVPEGATILPNPVGTAPAVMVELGGAQFFFIAGVPKELYKIFEESVMPWLAKNSKVVMRERVLRCFGLPEASIDEMLRGANLYGTRLSFRVKFPEILLKLVANDTTVAAADEKLCAAVTELKNKLGDIVYAEGETSLSEVVGKLLSSSGIKLSIAESCTGGYIANEITNVPGASEYFERGFVTYSNSSKQQLLGISEELLRSHGAVSVECAKAMSDGAKMHSGSDVAISVTGIAGPGGGSPEKPVGLVFIGLSSTEGTKAFKYTFSRDRLWFKAIVSATALDLLRKYLQGNLSLAK